jgi:hypothetical protein
MPPTLTKQFSGRQLRLLGAETATRESDGGVSATNAPGFSPEQTLVQSFTQRDRIDVTGVATGPRLAADAEYADDPRRAVAQWALQLQAWVNGQQGSDGFLFDSPERDESTQVFIESITQTWGQGAPLEVGYDLTLVVGTSDMRPSDPSVSAPTLSSSVSFAGQDLGHIERWEVEIQEGFDVFALALPESAEQNQLLASTGPIRRWTLVGTEIGDATARTNFDQNIRNEIATSESATLTTPFGKAYQAQVDDYESTRSAGLTRVGEYQLSLIQGST